MVKSLGAVALLSLAVLADAHGEHRRRELHARQNTTPLPSGSPSASAAPSGSAPAGSASSGVSSASSISISLRATNPTAVPLASISGFAVTRATIPLASTAREGSVPTLVAGAPELPLRSGINPTDYPELDKIPPTDSPEVDLWYDEVMNAGLDIPDLAPTNPGGCLNTTNTAFVNDKSRCWWTCGGCVTEDDITECDEKNHWGLTFDDGPGFFTSNLLHYLDEVKLKATFFIVGSRVTTFPDVLQTEYDGGHQIAVHTWSHKALTTLTNREIVAELGWTKKVIRDVLGVTPNMMRPPFGDIDNRVRAISLAMGLTPVMWTRSRSGLAFNTQDFDIRGVPDMTVQKVLGSWQNILTEVPTLDKGFIVLQHDLYQEFVDTATGYILPDGLAHNPPFSIEPVATCVNRRLADSYIETNDNSTYPPKAKLGVRTPGGPAGSDGGAGMILMPASVAASILGGAGFIAGLLF